MLQTRGCANAQVSKDRVHRAARVAAVVVKGIAQGRAAQVVVPVKGQAQVPGREDLHRIAQEDSQERPVQERLVAPLVQNQALVAEVVEAPVVLSVRVVARRAKTASQRPQSVKNSS